MLDMLDSDAVALEAARENVPGARGVPGTRVADAGCKAYAAILSNPPLHQGAAEDHTLLEQLVADAPSRLAPGGMLQIVVQRRLPLDRLFAAALRARRCRGGERPLSRVAGDAGVTRSRSVDSGHRISICATIRSTAPPTTPAARLRRARK